MVNLQDKEANREKILKAIKNTKPAVVTIDEIAKLTKLSRQTVSKHIDVLCAEGKIKVFKTIGKINLYEAV
jgi:predicted transcriptional regulator